MILADCAIIPGSTPACIRSSHAGPGRRRGSIYAVVMAMAVLVSLIGLSAVAVGRIGLRTASAGGDAAAAEVLAVSAIEHASVVLNSDPAWRTTYVNNTETAPLALGSGSYTWKLVDEADGLLSGGTMHPVRVFGYGRAGDARRAYSVRLTPSGTNVLLNSGTEQGLTAWLPAGSGTGLESHSLATSGRQPQSGTYYISVKGRADRFGGPEQDVTASIISGKSYYMHAWIRMTNVAEDPGFVMVVQQSGSPDAVFRVRAQTAGLGWTKVSGALTPSWSGTATKVYWRIETNVSNQEFHFDDAKLVQDASPNPMGLDLATWQQEIMP